MPLLVSLYIPHLLLQIVPTADLPKQTRLGVTLDLRRQSRPCAQPDGQYLSTSYRHRGFHRLPRAVVSGQSRYIQPGRMGGLSRPECQLLLCSDLPDALKYVCAISEVFCRTR
jgi:hypothetical protein